MRVLVDAIRARALRFERERFVGEETGARTRELCVLDAAVAHARELLVDRGDHLFGGVPRLGGRDDLEFARELRRGLEGGHVLRNLVVVDEALVKAAGLVAREHPRQKVELSISLDEKSRRDPGEDDARKLHAGLHVEALLAGQIDARRFRVLLRGAAGYWAEILFHELQRRLGIEVPGHDERRVVRDVPGSEERLHVVEAGAIQILGRADGQVVIRVLGREERLGQVHTDHPVWRVFVVLPALVLDHVALPRERLLVDVIEKEAHAIALEPERELETVLRYGLEVVGPVFGRRSVHVRGARALEVPEVHVLRHVLAPLEHHVLEEVSKALATLLFLLRTHVVPEVHRDDGRSVVFVEHHFEAVGEVRRAHRERDPGGVGVRRARRPGRDEQRGAQRNHAESGSTRAGCGVEARGEDRASGGHVFHQKTSKRRLGAVL